MAASVDKTAFISEMKSICHEYAEAALISQIKTSNARL